jgi:hypothetical protein
MPVASPSKPRFLRRSKRAASRPLPRHCPRRERRMTVPTKRRPEPREATVERWLARVRKEPNGGCWLWPGSLDSKGYAHTGYSIDGKTYDARLHQLFYTRFAGPVGEGLELDHLCRVRACCNPDHLEAVSHQENTRRGEAGGLRNRGPVWENSQKSHCKNGHPFDEANTYRTKNGNRRCRACNREEKRERKAKLFAKKNTGEKA